MKKFRITEMRKNEKGEWFPVDTYVEAKNKEALRKAINETKPSWIIDKNYRIKEMELI